MNGIRGMDIVPWSKEQSLKKGQTYTNTIGHCKMQQCGSLGALLLEKLNFVLC